MSDTYYAILGVSPRATSEEIKQAYRRLSMKLHPDQEGTSALFRQVQEAYEELIDPERRAAYDNELANSPGRRTGTRSEGHDSTSERNSGFWTKSRPISTLQQHIRAPIELVFDALCSLEVISHIGQIRWDWCDGSSDPARLGRRFEVNGRVGEVASLTRPTEIVYAVDPPEGGRIFDRYQLAASGPTDTVVVFSVHVDSARGVGRLSRLFGSVMDKFDLMELRDVVERTYQR